MWRVQDEIGITRNMTIAYDKWTCAVAQQQILTRQQIRLEVCGHRESSSQQMIDPIRNAIESIQTGQAEFGATDWSSLRNGSREKTNIDGSSKGYGSTDPAQKSVFYRKMIGRSGRACGMLFWRQREFISPLAQQAGREASQVCETVSKRASARIANLEANVGYAE
jgi:hypothetical protein